MKFRLGRGRIKPPSEKQVQRAVARLLRLVGFRVRSTSQARASMIAPGLPDLIFHHKSLPLGGWFECKPPIPRGYDPFDRTTWKARALDPAQLEFRADAVRCGQRHYWGGIVECQAAIMDMGLATQRDGRFTLTPHGQEAA